MGLVARKPVFGGLRTTKAQTSLRIGAVWSEPLLFPVWKAPYSQFSSETGFNLALSQTPYDRFSHDEAHIINSSQDLNDEGIQEWND